MAKSIEKLINEKIELQRQVPALMKDAEQSQELEKLYEKIQNISQEIYLLQRKKQK